jgi:hypothetical protein
MKPWEELQPQFREAVLRERADGRVTADIAEELHTCRQHVQRLLADEVTPQGALHASIEDYVVSHLRHSFIDDGDDTDAVNGRE